MRPTGVLLTVMALGVAGCGSSAPESAPTGATSHRAVPHAWAEARQQAEQLTAATYDVVSDSSTCTASTLDEPCKVVAVTSREHGWFTEDPDTLESDLQIERPPSVGTDRLVRVELRQLSDGSLYLRDDIIGGGCWLLLPKAARKQTFMKLDAALEVLRHAYVPDDGPSTGSPVELKGRAPAMEVLTALGLLDGQTEDQIFPGGQKAEIESINVPITVMINADGSPQGFKIRGVEVSAFLTGLFPEPRAYAIAAQAHNMSLRLSKLGVRKRVVAPDPDDLRPTDAPDDFRCGS